jgi:hypothetical protein
MNKYDIVIAEFNSSGIRLIAKQAGITHMREIGGGYAKTEDEDGELTVDHDGEPDSYVGFYALPVDGSEILVANTNGDPVWQEEDSEVFARLAEACGVEL